MRAISTLLGVIASIVTIFAAMVRLWWSKPKPLTLRGQPAYDVDGTPMEVQPRAKPWLATAAKWWLIVVFFGATIIFVIFVIFTLIDLSS